MQEKNEVEVDRAEKGGRAGWKDQEHGRLAIYLRRFIGLKGG